MNTKKILILVFFLLLRTGIFAQSPKFHVIVDERMELLTVVQYLSGYPILNQSESLAYRGDIDQYFGGMKQAEWYMICFFEKKAVSKSVFETAFYELYLSIAC